MLGGISQGRSTRGLGNTPWGSILVPPQVLSVLRAGETNFASSIIAKVQTILGNNPPLLDKWDTFIAQYGADHAGVNDIDPDTGQNYWNTQKWHDAQSWNNYDGDMVHRFLGDYTGDKATYQPYQLAQRDDYWDYAFEPEARAAAYFNYPNGLYWDAVEDNFNANTDPYNYSYLTTYPSVARAFAAGWDKSNYTYTNNDAHYGHVYSREVAYKILEGTRGVQLVGPSTFNSYLGYSGNYPLNLRWTHLLSKAENHIRQWRNNDFSSPGAVTDTTRQFMTPFMVGITCYCLCQYYSAMEVIEGNGNHQWPGNYYPNLPAAVEDMLTWLYDEAPNHTLGGRLLITDWDGPGTYDCFPYGDRDHSGGGATGRSPELNMIIAPSYCWLARHYNDASYITDYADRLFGGACTSLENNGNWWANNTTKQYNQFFYWAREFFEWRNEVLNS